jgi:hypothetical protein
MWRAPCPVCYGSGEIDGAPRRGVSVFPALEGLYLYLARRETDLENSVLVELDGERSPDLDFDADEGALLVIPTAILRCMQLQRELVNELRVTAMAAAGS